MRSHTGILKLKKRAKVTNWYQTPTDKITMAVINTLLVLVGLAAVIPLLYVLAASFSSGVAVYTGKVFLWPVDFSFDGYKMLLSNTQILTGYKNSIIYTAVAVLLGVTLTLLFAYPLSRKDFQGAKFMSIVMIITMFFSGGMIPMYLFIYQLGLLDTMWAVIMPSLLVPYNILVTRTYMQTNIPHDLYESASLDGCSDFKYFVSIVIPLCSTIIAVISLLYGVSMWNNYFNGMMYISSADKYPLQVVLRNILILSQGTVDTGDTVDAQEIIMMNSLLKYTVIVVSVVPMMVVYAFVQKYFVKGIMIGAVKG